jgi:hypothetical protein
MSNLTESDVFEIRFQDDVDSFPLRETFSNLRNAINDNQSQIDNLTSTPGGTEVTNARDNFATLRENIRARRGFGDRIISVSEFQVSAQSPADDTVQVGTGSGTVAGIGVNLTAAVNSASISPSTAGKHRIVMFALQSDNTITGVEGAEVNIGTDAVRPSLSATQMPLAYVDIDDAAVTINSGDIIDVRMFLIDPFRDFEYFDEEYTYNGDLVDTLVATDFKGNSFTFQFNYTGDKLTSVVVTIGGITYTRTYTYTGDVLDDAKFTMS